MRELSYMKDRELLNLVVLSRHAKITSLVRSVRPSLHNGNIELAQLC